MPFTPTQAGQHQVNVVVRGKHLQGSPFRLEVFDRPVYGRDYSKVGDQPASRFGSGGSGDGQFDRPYSVASNTRGEIVVVDYNNNCIQVFDQYGKFMFKFGSKGTGNGQFDQPSGVAVDHRNNQIVVADTDNHRIQIFDEKGTFFCAFGSNGSGDGQFNEPRGIVVDQFLFLMVSMLESHEDLKEKKKKEKKKEKSPSNFSNFSNRNH